MELVCVASVPDVDGILEVEVIIESELGLVVTELCLELVDTSEDETPPVGSVVSEGFAFVGVREDAEFLEVACGGLQAVFLVVGVLVGALQAVFVGLAMHPQALMRTSLE